jgi:universal stress protein A
LYRNVLAAIELTGPAADLVLRRARAYVAAGGGLSAIHVVEPQYVQYTFDPTFKSTLSRAMEQDAVDLAAARLSELCDPYGIDAEHRFVMLGRTADQVHSLAAEKGFDLIVMGSHGQEGLRRLLGSTANAVLHGSPVDVATVHIPREAADGR